MCLRQTATAATDQNTTGETNPNKGTAPTVPVYLYYHPAAARPVSSTTPHSPSHTVEGLG
ncbi:hypothetical protein Q8A73_020088 [Channa argus]|nr:hypothetical protein Q8A73_020088 [Channa argus]